jgi:5'-3' exonuclease
VRLHVIDGTYELFRAYFSHRPPHSGPDGQDLKATVGLVSSFLTLLESPEEGVTHVAAAFDNPIRSFRNDLFEGYKTEEGVPPELLAQFDEVERGVAALGVTVWSMKQFEADDALATAAARFGGEVDQVRILTPDKDLAQCVQADHVVQVDRHREKTYDELGVREKFGVPPASIPDLLALVGDTADGIPGLPGIGEKTAAALLARYGHLEQIPADPAGWKLGIRRPEKIAASLVAHREAALLFRRLATLVRDVPFQETLSALRWKGVPRAQFEAWCDRVASPRLKSRPKRWA